MGHTFDARNISKYAKRRTRQKLRWMQGRIQEILGGGVEFV